jgi:hypothetical protein
VSAQPADSMPGSAWRAILQRESPAAFASAFTRAPVLVASIADTTVRGASDIRTFFATSAAMYASIAFTVEANVGQATFLHWKGVALGDKTIEGLTVLSRDAAGLIERIELYHRPLSIVLAFASELRRRLTQMQGADDLAHPG